ncbi:hypothetical protein D3C76_1754010 [compost metagenome]
MHHRQQTKHHTLVACSQIVQELLTLLALLLHIIGHDSRKVIVLILPALPVGNVGFHAQQTIFHLTDCFICRNWNDVQG